jgi:hypothetical protein
MMAARHLYLTPAAMSKTSEPLNHTCGMRCGVSWTNRTHKHTQTLIVQTVKLLNIKFSLYSSYFCLTFSIPLSTLFPNTSPINALPRKRPRKNCIFTLTVRVFNSCFQSSIFSPSHSNPTRKDCVVLQRTGYHKPPPSNNRKRVGEP